MNKNLATGYIASSSKTGEKLDGGADLDEKRRDSLTKKIFPHVFSLETKGSGTRLRQRETTKHNTGWNLSLA